MPHYICVTCGTQHTESNEPPPRCPICEDERQYIGHAGQQWVTLEDFRRTHLNHIVEVEPNLFSIQPEPKAGIGQRAFLVRTPAGNLLWDCVSPIDDATIARIRSLGGLDAIAVSHPHFYTTMVEWSRAFENIPIHIHRHETKWVMRPDPVVQFWDGDTKPLFGWLTLVRTGGHFAGFQVLHWPLGANNKGVLFAGDQPFVCADRRWVSFMYSYPNLIPLGPAAVREIVSSLAPFAFDRLYGAFSEQVVMDDAMATVERSADRYLRMIGE